MKEFYMCLVDGTGACSRKHTTLAEAKAEAERLARREQKGVSVLGVFTYCVPGPVLWAKRCEDVGYLSNRLKETRISDLPEEGSRPWKPSFAL